MSLSARLDIGALTSNKISFYTWLGLTCLVFPFVWNVWTIETFMSSDGKLEPLSEIIIWFFDAVLVLAGLLVLKYGQQALVNFALVTVSLVVTLSVFEIVLRAGILDGESNPHPIWVPRKWKVEDEKIDRANYEFASHHPFGFNDRPRERSKPQGIRRVAVLGDSFVWGDGLRYDQIWSHKLEKRIINKFSQIEVLSWGKNGWSTLDEFNFLREHGVEYSIDLLIVGLSMNDPDMHTIPQQYLKWQESSLLSPFRFVLPNVFDFGASYLNVILQRFVLSDYGYDNWVDTLYAPSNLEQYGRLLRQFADYCRDRNIPLLFVLTPNNHNVFFRQQFDRIIPLLGAANIQYLDLYPAVSDKLHAYNERLLWANLADGHPGDLVTEVNADEVFKYLEKREILKNLAAMDERREGVPLDESNR